MDFNCTSLRVFSNDRIEFTMNDVNDSRYGASELCFS